MRYKTIIARSHMYKCTREHKPYYNGLGKRVHKHIVNGDCNGTRKVEVYSINVHILWAFRMYDGEAEWCVVGQYKISSDSYWSIVELFGGVLFPSESCKRHEYVLFSAAPEAAAANQRDSEKRGISRK